MTNTSEYSRIHYQIKLKFGKANCCENKACEGVCYRFEWALIKGREYSTDRKDYMHLCTRCHRRYDQLGKPFSDKHRSNLSKAKMGISVGLGVPLSEAHRKAISNGLPRKLTHLQMIEINKLHYRGVSYRKIAEMFDTNHYTVSLYINKKILPKF